MAESPMQHFRNCLEKRHLYFTSQREELVRHVLTSRGHFGVDEIYDWARHRNLSISRSTIYRTLQLMAECSLLEERDFQRGYKLYEVSVGKEPHEHMTCVECNKVVEFKSTLIEDLQENLIEKEGFLPIHHSFVIYGLCRGCRGKQGERQQEVALEG